MNSEQHKTIGTSYSFHAEHAVADDPGSSHMHPHSWTVDVDIRGPLCGPGWVMDYKVLHARLVEALPVEGEDFNAWARERNATNEVLAGLIADSISLPKGIEVVRVVLTEDGKHRAYWP